MRAIKIDSINKTVEYIEIDGELETLQHHVGGYITIAHYFENSDDLLVDDEGLLKYPKNFFWFAGLSQPLAGNGLIVGSTKNGEFCSVKMNISVITASIRFFNLEQMQKFVRMGAVDYNVYLTTDEGTKKLASYDLGAFDNEKKNGGESC